MPNVFFGKPKGGMMEFDDHESEHFKVVRAKEGERIEVTDGNGILYKVILRKIGKRKSYGDIIEAYRVESFPKTLLKIYVGSSSWDRLRLLVEKAVEIGADEIGVFRADRSKRDYTKKRKKLEVVIRDSAKQCKRMLFPRLHLFSSLKNVLEKEVAKIVSLDFGGMNIEEFDVKADESYAIVVGPEGGFSEDEKKILEKKTIVLSLGKRVLRFETAGLVALTIFSYKMGKL